MPIGIIVWLILIFIIAYCTCPGFLTALATIFGIFAFGILILWLLAKLTGKKSKETLTDIDREKAIDKWEKKWGRPHPTRLKK